jgi:hypothetical protein
MSHQDNMPETTEPGTPRRSLKGQILGGGRHAVMGAVGTAGVGAGMGVAAAGRTIDQSINVLTNNIDPGQVIKYCIYAIIILGAMVLAIGIARNIVIGLELAGCAMESGIAMFNPENACIPSNMASFRNPFMWEIEWILRAFIFLCVAIAICTIIYIWAKWLMDKLLRAEYYIKMIEDWIFGFKWEGIAERDEALETRL